MTSPTFALVALAICLLLLIAEVFLPTAGLLFVPAAALLGLSLFGAFADSPGRGFQFLVAEAVLVPSTLAASTFAFSRLMRRPPSEDEPSPGPGREGPDLARLVGTQGRAVTPLRPSGKVEFDGRRLEGVALEGLIPPGAPVMVVAVRSGRLMVRDLPEEFRADRERIVAGSGSDGLPSEGPDRSARRCMEPPR